jgi:site-specific recombinase
VTASALSGRTETGVESFAEEVIHLMRSQMTAIAGNVIGVVPCMIALCGIYQFWTQTPLLSEEEALKTLHDFSLFGSTPLFAYFTGILLWISSLFAGWADNWFCYHRISAAIESNHSLHQLFGSKGAKWLSRFFQKHTFGIAASISLGMLLTYTPLILQFFGFHMEVRHVTLSSGALTAAMMSLPLESLQTREFGLAVLGVLSMGFLNVVVCFGVAMLASIKARRVRAPKRAKIYLAILARLLQKPYLLIWPASPTSLQEESSN